MLDTTQSPQTIVDNYTLGTKNRDIDLLKSIFHEDCIMTGYLGPDFLNGSTEPFYDALRNNEIGPDYTSETTELNVTDRIATATVVEKNLLGLDFTSHFHLAQQPDGQWLITSKLFRHA